MKKNDLIQAKTVEVFKAMAAENGVELTDEQAAEYFAKLKNNELTDEELTSVAGGFKPSR